MTDPWSGIATLLAEAIEKYGTEILQELDAETPEESKEDARTFVKNEKQ